MLHNCVWTLSRKRGLTELLGIKRLQTHRINGSNLHAPSTETHPVLFLVRAWYGTTPRSGCAARPSMQKIMNPAKICPNGGSGSPSWTHMLQIGQQPWYILEPKHPKPTSKQKCRNHLLRQNGCPIEDEDEHG